MKEMNDRWHKIQMNEMHGYWMWGKNSVQSTAMNAFGGWCLKTVTASPSSKSLADAYENKTSERGMSGGDCRGITVNFLKVPLDLK